MSSNAADTNEPAFNDSQIPSKPSHTAHRMQAGDREIAYRATADWMSLRKLHHPVAKMFHVAYVADGDRLPGSRPLTFVFNGGPGAASAFLHMGCAGPRRVEFGEHGSLPPSPASIVDNMESWLPFTDLVFVDPLGTGFSRALKPKAGSGTSGSSSADASKGASDATLPKENKDFWEVDRDIAALGEFITRYLSANHRWTSPVFIAGESYGGFRVAKLARALQQENGVGLSGALLISPAIEFDGIFGSDYNLTHWVEVFPALVTSAHQHQRSCFPTDTSMAEVAGIAAEFATSKLVRWLACGDTMPQAERNEVARRMSELCGMPVELLAALGGRVPSSRFCRELLVEQSRLLGRYDASVSTTDPYRDRESYEGPDPTLFSIDRLFSAAINQQLRSTLKVETDLEYRLLSMDVYKDWSQQDAGHAFRGAAGAMDDLRYGMSLNEHLRLFISHGYFDLITPFFASQRLAALMKLGEAESDRVQLRNYKGGHMFYSWDQSRRDFAADTEIFFRECLKPAN